MRILTASDYPTRDIVDAVASYSAPGAPGRRSFSAKGWEIPSIYDYGIVPDGVTDATAAINAAWAALAAAGRMPLLGVPPSAGEILVSGILTPPVNAGLVGLFGKPRVLMAGTSQTVINNPGFTLSGLTLIGTHSSTSFKFALQSTSARIENLRLENWNSGFDIAGNRNDLIGIEGVNLRGSLARISGGRYNTLDNLEGVNITTFLVYLSDGAAFNNVLGPRKRVDFGSLTDWQRASYTSDISKNRFGLECVGIRYDCYRNSVMNYYAEYTGDAGFSCSGYENTITGGRVIECEGNALTLIGSRNTASNIIAVGNKRGIGAIPTAGGLSKDNVLIGCVALDNWYAGFTNERTQIREWVSGGTYTASSTFCRYGLNNYQTATGVSTNTFGTVPPTHTSGVVSDGVNDWLWISSDPVTLHADRNKFIGCVGIGGGQGRNAGTGLDAGSGTDFFIESGSGLNTQFYASNN